MPMSFAPARHRDAWFVVRGYVYQVETTLERWLTLTPEGVLELERGEDIDTVANWCSGERNEQRLLEQIKHCEGSITLNSSVVRAALANFAEHRVTNPDVALTLRFVTTATIGQERAPAALRHVKGLESWIDLREGSIPAPSCLVRLAIIRRLLRQGERPEGTPDATWQSYRASLVRATTSEMAALVAAVEWSTGAPALEDLRPRIRGHLVREGWAANDEAAENQYAVLFVHVMHALCRPGVKRLTKGALAALLAQPHLSTADSALLSGLRDSLHQLQGDVAALRAVIEVHTEELVGLKQQVVDIAASYGVNGNISTTAQSASLLSRPCAAQRRSARVAAVASVATLLAQHTWVAIHGTSGSGKTELAIQISESSPTTDWLGFRDLTSSAAAFRIQGILARLVPEPVSVDERRALAASRLPAGHLVVFDDLPPYEADDALGAELAALACAFTGRDIHLFTTCTLPPPQRIRVRLGTALAVTTVPPFNEDDAAGLLAAYGAPAAWSDLARVRFLLAVSAGHAELLLTAAMFLEQNGWRCSEQEVRSLIAREFATAIEGDVMRRVQATVASGDARQLLFRASIAIGSLSMEELTVLADVEPAISGPRTALASLEGLWLQGSQDGSYSVCPLARGFASEVPPLTRKTIHRILGDRILQRATLGPIDVLTGIAYFVEAAEANRAGSLLVLALCSFAGLKSPPAYDAGLLDLWANDELPREMDLGLRVYIRTQQLAARQVAKRSVDFIVSDIFSLAEAAMDGDSWAVLTLLPCAATLSRSDYARTTRLVLRGISLGKDIGLPHGGRLDLSRAPAPSAFLWHQASHISGVDDAREWLTALRTLSPSTLAAAASGEAYESGCVGLCDRLWMREADKPSAEQDWPCVVAILSDVADVANALNLSILKAAARRAQVIVRAEYQNDLTSARALADESIRDARGEPRSIFLLAETIGRQCVMLGSADEGRPYLEQALEHDSGHFEVYRLHGLLYLSHALGSRDRNDALRVAGDAVVYVAGARRLPWTELAKANGEAAIAAWLAGDLRRACEYFADACRTLFDHEEGTESRWRDLAVLLGQLGGWLAFIVVTGAPPDADESGNSYAAPAPGLFLTTSPQRHTLLDDARLAGLFYALVQLADRFLGDDAWATWAQRGRERARRLRIMRLEVIFDMVAMMGEAVRLDGAAALRTARASSATAVVGPPALLCAIASYARLAVADPSDAREMAITMRAEFGDGSNDEGGAAVAQLLELVSRRSSPNAELSTIATSPSADRCTFVAALIAASVQDDCTYQQALEYHLSAALALDELDRSPLSIRRRLFGPLVVDYWLHAVERSAFQFKAPVELRRDLESAANLGGDAQARLVLRRVGAALGARFPPAAQRWFDKA